MPEKSQQLSTIVNYIKSHWPSTVKPEWQVSLEEYPDIVASALKDSTNGTTQNRQLIRVAGISGSGKTTQILPAVTAYCEKYHYRPALVAARQFVKYHPHYQEILDYYGEQNLRRMTDEFSTVMLFLVLSKLVEGGYDITLDVTLLDPAMEAIFLQMLKAFNYQILFLMIAVSPTVTEHFLASRTWRHTKETEQEFIRATSKALAFYAEQAPDSRIILWSVYDLEPIYDGPIKAALDIFSDYSSRTVLPQPDDDARRSAKITYLTK